MSKRQLSPPISKRDVIEKVGVRRFNSGNLFSFFLFGWGAHSLLRSKGIRKEVIGVLTRRDKKSRRTTVAGRTVYNMGMNEREEDERKVPAEELSPW